MLMSSTASAGAAPQSRPSESLLALALALSLAVHLAALAALHAFPRPGVTPGERRALQVRLVNAPEPPPSAREVTPAPAMRQEREAAPARSTAREAAEPPHQAARTRAPRRPAEVPAAEPVPPPEPLAREATVSAPSLPQAPVAAARPNEPHPTAQRREPSEQALARYGQSISELLARSRQYPRLARLRGWEGAVGLRLDVGPDGKLIGATLRRSSGHDVLDEEALDMAKRLSRLPQPPEGLRERPFAVDVQVVFELTP
ncbi:MAG: TonB family protein [Betaproteobacteria bacterium]|nr:TonB family protein [Betaproteobacteria bacterium]